MSKKKDERQFKLRHLLAKKEKSSILELSKELHVTCETIRKDIVELESQNIVKRHKGYVYLNDIPSEMPMLLRNQEYFEEKKSIMLKACEYIKDGMMVYLDAGSTCQAGIPFLQSKKGITIVTPSILVAYKCCIHNIHTIVLGGKLSDTSYRSYGDFPCVTMDRIHIDIAILGSLGIKNNNGFTTHENEYTLKRHVMQQSECIIIVADAHKFDVSPSYTYAKFREADIFITNPINKNNLNQIKDIKKIIQV